MSQKVTRLFKQFKPENYQLLISPNKESMSFTGKVSIKGKKVGRPSQRLTFHQRNMKITGATIVKHDKKGDFEVKLSRINLHDKFNEVRLHSDTMFYPGNYTVNLEFEANITRPMNGIYPSFFSQGGVNKVLIATQFESHSAREAFPCIDEPEAKATFDLTLSSPKDEVVIANSPVKSELVESESKLTSFETTPIMSTYLLAFVIGDIAFKEAKTKDGVLVRAYATPDNVNFTDFALKTAVKYLEFYNKYFDIPYPLAKCDMVALPDFSSGAMENWGLITFREQSLLVDPANTSLHLKQYVANVVAHELTHQWFGNLVTMRWWTDLWLNESFASWMAYLAVDKLFPDWKVWTQFIVDEQGLALKQDALEHTHPIEVEVHHPDEIRTIFDAISYEKGASVLHMLHEYLGPETFRDGLRIYLKRHAYSNTDTVDLWTALEEASSKPIKDFMSAWTSQNGYPVILATVNQDSVQLKQERFYLNSQAQKETTTWPIPLLPSKKLGTEFINKSSETLKAASDNSGLVFNHNRTSFFRVVYDSKHLADLAPKIKLLEINELDRLGILSDEIEAAKAGYSKTTDVLELLKAYENEDSSVVWDIMSGVIGSIRATMEDDDIRNGLKGLSRLLVTKQLKRLGWDQSDKDSHFDQLLRPTILGIASYGEIPKVVAKAKEIFTKMKRPEDLHPNLRGVVYGTIARTGGKAEFDKFVKMHNNSTNSEERVTLAGALTGFEHPEQIDQALAMIISDDVRLQDVAYWIAYSFMNRHAKQKTWEWMKQNWDWLSANIGEDLSFTRLAIYSARAFSDTSFLTEYNAFFTAKMKPGFARTVNQGIETIQWQAAWKDRDLKSLREYFKS